MVELTTIVKIRAGCFFKITKLLSFRMFFMIAKCLCLGADGFVMVTRLTRRSVFGGKNDSGSHSNIGAF